MFRIRLGRYTESKWHQNIGVQTFGNQLVKSADNGWSQWQKVAQLFFSLFTHLKINHIKGILFIRSIVFHLRTVHVSCVKHMWIFSELWIATWKNEWFRIFFGLLFTVRKARTTCIWNKHLLSWLLKYYLITQSRRI